MGGRSSRAAIRAFGSFTNFWCGDVEPNVVHPARQAYRPRAQSQRVLLDALAP
jgi:hypothetical protein